ncbi:MAG: structural protein [Marivibrio sp.]|uniref:structural protein n=1 Tax=Marivibrio sp. TaxID=2039719 RepID=UPI0032EEBA4F
MEFDRPFEQLPRGIRNNNPGNIRHSPTKWRGQLADQSADDAFVQFEHPIYGLRAMARILMTYQRKHGLKTIRAIVNRYAPPVENDTDAYARHVAKEIAVGLDYEIDLAAEREAFATVLRTMVRHENGEQPYPDFFFDDAITLAAAS